MSRSAHNPARRAAGAGLYFQDSSWELKNLMENRIVDTAIDIGPPDSGHTHNESTPEYAYNFDIDTGGAVLIGGTYYAVGAANDKEAVAASADPPIGATNDNIVVAIYAYVNDSGNIAYAGVVGTAAETDTAAWAARPTDEDIAADLGSVEFVRLADMLVIRDSATSASSDTAADADFDKTSCYDVVLS